MHKRIHLPIRSRKWQVRLATGLVILFVAGLLAGKALALATGPLSATGLTAPVNVLWLTGALSGHLWASDAALGFCRLDPVRNSTTAQLNPATCVKVGGGVAGQAAFDPKSNSVYLADASPNSQGAYRLAYDPATETVGSPVLLAAGQILDPVGPRAAALGPDGRLYLGLSNSQIIRITNPSGLSQTVEVVGATSNTLPAVSFSFVGNDLYIAETIRVTKVLNMGACFPGSCRPAEPTGINVLAPTALVYDGGANLFVGDFVSVTTYNPNNGAQALYATAGATNGASVPFGGISGLGIDLQGNLLVGQNPTRAPLAGQIWAVILGTPLPDLVAGEFVRPLASLKTVPVPEPANLMDFVADKPAAIQLGKALFWDTQVGSDGQTACATCHFQAGADVRSKNQIDPGLRANPSDTSFQLAGPNYQLQPRDFPLTKHVDAGIAGSPVTTDANDIISSQGVMLHNFAGVKNGSLVDSCTYLADPVFNVGGINVRRVEPRNSPSAVNAVFNFRNFWDGRANNIFNGINPFGPRDTGAAVWKYNGTTAVLTPVAIDNASLASQAVGPPGSFFEMSCDNRTLADIGRKLINSGLMPLATQRVDPNDSVLGPIAGSRSKKPTNGLTASYRDLVQKAFRPEYWTAASVGSQKIPQIESNFSLFFGLAVQLYEATLVANNTPFDQFLEGNNKALTPNQQIGLSLFAGQGRCVACHSGPELTKAAVASVSVERLERMFMGDGGCAVYDNGFYNIGVRPTSNDIGIGGTDPFGNPLSDSGMAKLGRFTDPNLVPPFGSASCDSRINVDGAFKAPGLRNIELNGPYFHNGGQATLWHVVDFYNRGGDFSAQNLANLDPNIQGLGLTDSQKTNLVLFLESLTDERVRWERAPFDHPALCVPNGAGGDTSKVTPTKGTQEATDTLLCLPAVGANGATKPLIPFLGLDPMSR